LRFAGCNYGLEEHKVPPAYEHADDTACSFTAFGTTMLYSKRYCPETESRFPIPRAL